VPFDPLLQAEPAIRAAIGLGAGLIAGSFIATILIRWPDDRSVLSGRSHCDACKAPLGVGDLIPVLSWLVRRGRCRHCGARIDPRHPAIEAAAGMIGLVALLGHMLPLAAVTALLGWWLLLAAALDLEHQWLPDRLTLPLIPLGLAAAWAGFGPPLAERLAGAAIGWAFLALVAWAYRRLRGRDGLGGGDPKLLGAIGAWIGAWNLPLVLLGAGLFGIAAILLMRLRGQEVAATSRLPLGTLMILAAWPIWLVAAQGEILLR
jgi:leader peptidase (prepilin peptidase)/N-methyltransferase